MGASRDDKGDMGALDSLDHDELVAVLNRLYANAGEHPLSPSAATASTDRELRDMIMQVRHRQARKAGTAPPPSVPAPARAAATNGRPRVAGAQPAHVLCVLVTRDEATVTRARALMRSRGRPLVVVDTDEALVRVLASITPTHVVIDLTAGDVRVAELLGTRAADVPVYYGDGDQDAVATLAAIL